MATRTSELLKRARVEAEKHNYSVFGGEKSTLVKKCPKCGKPSLVACISEDKEWIVSFCFYRWYIGNGKSLKCTYSKKWPNRKADTDRKEADAMASSKEEVLVQEQSAAHAEV